MTNQTQHKNKSVKTLILLVGIAAGAFGILLFQKFNTPKIVEVTPSPYVENVIASPSPDNLLSPTTTPIPIIKPASPKPVATPQPTATPDTSINYDQLKNVAFTLPDGWTSVIATEELSSVKGLFISAPGGGYINIRALNYPGNIGRREFYCQAKSDECLQREFISANFGNISGYLDKKFGIYFGVKGNFFYSMIVAHGPPDSEFEKNYQQVLDSLVF